MLRMAILIAFQLPDLKGKVHVGFFQKPHHHSSVFSSDSIFTKCSRWQLLNEFEFQLPNLMVKPSSSLWQFLPKPCREEICIIHDAAMLLYYEGDFSSPPFSLHYWNMYALETKKKLCQPSFADYTFSITYFWTLINLSDKRWKQDSENWIRTNFTSIQSVLKAILTCNSCNATVKVPHYGTTPEETGHGDSCLNLPNYSASGFWPTILFQITLRISSAFPNSVYKILILLILRSGNTDTQTSCVRMLPNNGKHKQGKTEIFTADDKLFRWYWMLEKEHSWVYFGRLSPAF